MPSKSARAVQLPFNVWLKACCRCSLDKCFCWASQTSLFSVAAPKIQHISELSYQSKGCLYSFHFSKHFPPKIYTKRRWNESNLNETDADTLFYPLDDVFKIRKILPFKCLLLCQEIAPFTEDVTMRLLKRFIDREENHRTRIMPLIVITASSISIIIFKTSSKKVLSSSFIFANVLLLKDKQKL